MELINNFANLSKTLSEKFHLSKSETSLYLLALIHDASDLARYSEFMDPETFGNYLIEDGVLNSGLFRAIKESGLIDLRSYDKHEIREFSDYLITEYLKSANISLSSSNLQSFIVELAAEAALELHSPDEDYTEWVVYISNIRAGDIVIRLLKKLEEKSISEGCGIVGNEPNKILNFLSEINYFIHDTNENLLTTDESPLTRLGDDYSVYGEVRIAISLPPFTPVRQPELEELYKFTGSREKIHFSELAYIELMLKRVSERGKVIAVVRNEFLFSKKSKVFREKYLRSDWIEKVIALPKEFVNFPVDISVIVFNKAKLEKGFVVFDGSEDKFEKTKVGNEEILSNNVDLRAVRYAVKEDEKIDSILSKYPQDEVKKIKDLVTKVVSGHNYSPNHRIISDSKEILPYVRIADLSKYETEFDFDISKVERKISREKAGERTIINFSAVLVSKIAPKLKPTYFNFTGQPIVIGSDVIALKLKENVNPQYFLTQLHSKLVQTQVAMISFGAAVKRITREDFLNVRIILPPLAEQELQIFERLAVNEEKAVIREQLSVAKEEIETTEYDVIAAIAHNLNQKLGQIVDDYSALILFLQGKEKNQLPIRFDEMLRPVRNGELMENVPTFSKVVDRLQNNLLDTASTMKTTENILQKSSIDAERLDIIGFFKNSIKADFDGPQFSIKIESKLKSLSVSGDLKALKDAFRNLIENARKHGFTRSDLKYRIVFEISKFTDESGDNFARIVYKNNGNPFPRSYRFEDYVRLGTRVGRNKGTGIGGFFVKKVIDLHKGRFREINIHENNEEIFQVQMEILLPLADQDLLI